MKQHQHVLPINRMPPTIGRAMARPSFQPCSPELEDVLLDGAAGPAIRVSLNIEAALGKNGFPATGGWRQEI